MQVAVGAGELDLLIDEPRSDVVTTGVVGSHMPVSHTSAKSS